MTLDQVKESYNNLITEQKNKLSKSKKAIFQVGTIRLLVVLIAVAIGYILWGNTAAVVITIIIAVIIFLFFLKYHNKLFKQKRYSELQIENAENELKGINYDFSAFDGAPERIDANHSFSLDLDIFGNRSFFQSINRTVTTYGKNRLANTILTPAEKKETIIARQKAIEELSSKPHLLSHFRAIGQMNDTEHLDVQNLTDSFSNTRLFINSFWRFMPYIAPILFIAISILCLLAIIPQFTWGFFYTVAFIGGSTPIKAIRQKLNLFEKKIETLQTYSNLFKIIESENFNSSYLKQLQTEVTEHHSASDAIRKLKYYSDNLNQSFTVLGFIILNPIFFWGIIYGIKIEKWIELHKQDIDKWFDAISEFDSLASLAIFAYNHPDYTYPEVSDKFIFEGKALGHPLLNRDVCVRNDVNIGKHPYFLIITGANMAGKSTYLRTIGINHTLACIGAPVCTDSLIFYPSHLVTNLRTSDSLTDNESYFFAELKRLKMIIDRLQSGEQLFIILDEILKGTNSQDKQKGSIALMKQLISLTGTGIIATHDLALGHLEEEYPEAVKNYRFEADIKDENLSFSYKIREGVAENMNACFLMKKMGITGL